MVFEWIGAGGLCLILIAFFMDEFNKWSDDDYIFNFMNLFGAVLLLGYALSLGAAAIMFVVLEAVWAGIALVKLGKITKARRAKIVPTQEEAQSAIEAAEEDLEPYKE